MMFIALIMLLLVGCAQELPQEGGVRAERFYVEIDDRAIPLWMATTPAGDRCYVYAGGHTQISCVKGE